jgi:hypothetical protein
MTSIARSRKTLPGQKHLQDNPFPLRILTLSKSIAASVSKVLPSTIDSPMCLEIYRIILPYLYLQGNFAGITFKIRSQVDLETTNCYKFHDIGVR